MLKLHTYMAHIEVYISIRDRTEYMSSKEVVVGKSKCSSVSLFAVQHMLGSNSITFPKRVESLAAQCFCNNIKNWSCSISMWADGVSVESVTIDKSLCYKSWYILLLLMIVNYRSLCSFLFLSLLDISSRLVGTAWNKW